MNRTRFFRTAGLCVLSAGLLGSALHGESRADEVRPYPGQVLQSGHASSAWWRGSDGRGLTLSFDDRDKVRDTARRELRRVLLDRLPEGHFLGVFADDVPDGRPRNRTAARLEAASRALTLQRGLAGLEADLRPFASVRADLDEVEVRSGVRLRWGRGLTGATDSEGLRAYAHTTWESRTGFGQLFDEAEDIEGHELEAGLSLALGNWSLTVEATVFHSGSAMRDSVGTSGLLGYSARF